MIVSNTTPLSERFIRRMVRWVCRQLKYPAGAHNALRRVDFRNSTYGKGCGRA